ncbi:MAG TPA: hypothetical protein VF618_09365 [Thermoanaerobaculia bacterium]
MTFAEVLVEQALRIPDTVTWRWRERNGDHAVLEFPVQHEGGFEVSIDASPDSVGVYADAAHAEYQAANEAERLEVVVTALEDARLLLSPTRRLRVRYAAEQPYSWCVEKLVDGEWTADFTTALLFWNYFGRRSEEVYQNRVPWE